MVRKLEDFIDIAKKMIEDDNLRNKAFTAYEKMYHNDWDLPPLVDGIQWIRKVVSSDPHDAVAAGVRVLSSTEPNVTFLPLAANMETKQRANAIERNLVWQLKSINRRRQATVEADVVKSALMYDAVFATVVDLDHQIKQKEAFQGNAKRERAARRYSRFLVNVYNPRDVHVRFSNYMPEAILLYQRRTGQSIMDEWGKLAKNLDPKAEYDYYDYTDYEERCVWCQASLGGEQDAIKILGPAEHELPFLFWVAMTGGSTMEHSEKHRYQPVLYPVYTSGAWETQNVARTLYISEMIRLASRGRFKEEGPIPIEGRTTEIEYGEANPVINVTPGDTLTPIPPEQLDRGMAEVDDRLGAGIDKATVSRILQNADIPSGTAFATLNLATQTAVGALKPAKGLAERALAEMFTLMLLWVEYTGEALYAYGTDKKKDLGEEYVVEPDTIEPDAIYIEVELTPDVPTDRQQRANTAAIMVQSIDYPKEMALEDVGVTDPQGAMKQRIFEKLLDAKVQAAIQMSQIQMQMMVQQAQQEAALATETGVPGGAAYNPAEGGLPPAMANPFRTREQVTGETRGGVPVEELVP